MEGTEEIEEFSMMRSIGHRVEYNSRSGWIATEVHDVDCRLGFKVSCKKNKWLTDWALIREVELSPLPAEPMIQEVGRRSKHQQYFVLGGCRCRARYSSPKLAKPPPSSREHNLIIICLFGAGRVEQETGSQVATPAPASAAACSAPGEQQGPDGPPMALAPPGLTASSAAVDLEAASRKASPLDRERGTFVDDGIMEHATKFLTSFGGVSGLLKKLSESTRTAEENIFQKTNAFEWQWQSGSGGNRWTQHFIEVAFQIPPISALTLIPLFRIGRSSS